MSGEGQTTIDNLESAIRCISSNRQCCAQLRVEIATLLNKVNRLESQVNSKLDKSEKQSIVESAINTIKSLPLGAFAFGATVASSGDLLNALTRVEAVEGQTRRVATFLHNRTANAINSAEIAAAQARRAEAASAVARQEALSALGKAAEALGRIAVIASAIAALGISLGTLLTLGNRIDALERYLDSVASGLSNALSTALQALGLGRENKTEINAL